MGFPTPIINAKWNTPDKAADTLYIQTLLDWLYDDWDTHPVNMPVIQVMASAVIKGTPFPWAPHII